MAKSRETPQFFLLVQTRNDPPNRIVSNLVMMVNLLGFRKIIATIPLLPDLAHTIAFVPFDNDQRATWSNYSFEDLTDFQSYFSRTIREKQASMASLGRWVPSGMLGLDVGVIKSNDGKLGSSFFPVWRIGWWVIGGEFRGAGEQRDNIDENSSGKFSTFWVVILPFIVALIEEYKI